MHSGALNIFKSHMLAEIETGRQLSGGIDQFELVIMDVYEASSSSAVYGLKVKTVPLSVLRLPQGKMILT